MITHTPPTSPSLRAHDPLCGPADVPAERITVTGVCHRLGVNALNDLGDLQGKSVFLRVDANVPWNTENFEFHPRIRQAVASITSLVNRGARVVVASHHSAVATDENHTLDKGALVARLRQAYPDLSNTCSFLPCLADNGPGVTADAQYVATLEQKLSTLRPGQALFLDNMRRLRFETDPTEQPLRERMTRLFDVVVNDAFGVAHRAGQFSVDTISAKVPFRRKALGPCSAQEWANVFRFVEGAEPRSVALVLGGDLDKFETKLRLVAHLLESDRIGMVYLAGVFGTTFLASNESGMGRTPVSSNAHHRSLLRALVANNPDVSFQLPSSYTGFTESKEIGEWPVALNDGKIQVSIPADGMALDQRADDLSPLLEQHGISRVLAVGPLGYYRHALFQTGTLETYRHLASWANNAPDRQLLVGGGNSLELLLQLPEFRHADPSSIMLSSGGGALLDAVSQALDAKGDGAAIALPAISSLRDLSEVPLPVQ